VLHKSFVKNGEGDVKLAPEEGEGGGCGCWALKGVLLVVEAMWVVA